MTRAILTEVFSLDVKVRLLRATRSSPYLKSCRPQSHAFTSAVFSIVILLIIQRFIADIMNCGHLRTGSMIVRNW